MGDEAEPPLHCGWSQNPPLFSAAEENPYSPTYQFPASTPSPISEGNNKGPYIYFFCTNAALSIYFLPGFFLLAELYAAS